MMLVGCYGLGGGGRMCTWFVLALLLGPWWCGVEVVVVVEGDAEFR